MGGVWKVRGRGVRRKRRSKVNDGKYIYDVLNEYE